MDRKEVVQLALVVGAVGGLLYLAAKLIGYGRMQPEKDSDNEMGLDLSGIYSGIMPSPVGEHFLAPNEHLGPTTVMAVRYPPRSGHEISCLIAEGFTPLFRPKPSDYDWIVNPPSEATL